MLEILHSLFAPVGKCKAKWNDVERKAKRHSDIYMYLRWAKDVFLIGN